MEAIWMPLNLSIKDVPDDLAEALKNRARANHRSLQGELMAMIEAHVGARPFRARGLLEQVRGLGISTNANSVAMVREDRDRR